MHPGKSDRARGSELNWIEAAELRKGGEALRYKGERRSLAPVRRGMNGIPFAKALRASGMTANNICSYFDAAFFLA